MRWLIFSCTIAHRHQSLLFSLEHHLYLLFTCSQAILYQQSLRPVYISHVWCVCEMWANELLCNYQTTSCGLVPACTAMVENDWQKLVHLVAIKVPYQLYFRLPELMTGYHDFFWGSSKFIFFLIHTPDAHFFQKEDWGTKVPPTAVCGPSGGRAMTTGNSTHRPKPRDYLRKQQTVEKQNNRKKTTSRKETTEIKQLERGEKRTRA